MKLFKPELIIISVCIYYDQRQSYQIFIFHWHSFKKDKVLTVNDVSEYEYFNPSSTFKNYLTENLEWPNEIDTVPGFLKFIKAIKSSQQNFKHS